LEKGLKIDTLLLAGTKGSYGSTVQALHAQMDKQKTQLLKIDDVGDVMNEAVSPVPNSDDVLSLWLSDSPPFVSFRSPTRWPRASCSSARDKVS
jgi:hypothetical protein